MAGAPLRQVERNLFLRGTHFYAVAYRNGHVLRQSLKTKSLPEARKRLARFLGVNEGPNTGAFEPRTEPKIHGPHRRLQAEAHALKGRNLTDREIANEIGVSLRTVQRYLSTPRATKWDPLLTTWFHNPTKPGERPRVAEEDSYARLVRAAVAAGYDPRELALSALEALKR